MAGMGKIWEKGVGLRLDSQFHLKMFRAGWVLEDFMMKISRLSEFWIVFIC